MTKREKGPDRLCGFLLRGARINQSTRPAKSKPVRGSHDNTGAKTLGKTGKRSTVRNPEKELEDLTLMGTSIVSWRNGATGPDSNPPSGPGEQEKPTLGPRQHRSDCHHHERSERDTSVQVRGNDHRTPTHQTTSLLGRDDWKARTRTEGDSKAPSASRASSTCRKARARGKHTRNVVNNTGERKRGRVSEGNKETVPKNGHARKTLHPMPATASAEAGQSPKLKEEQLDRKSHSSSFFSILGVTTTPKEKEKGKKGAKLLSRLST